MDASTLVSTVLPLGEWQFPSADEATKRETPRKSCSHRQNKRKSPQAPRLIDDVDRLEGVTAKAEPPGRRRIADALNVYINRDVEPDLEYDLDRLPWPLPTGHFIEVFAYDVIEHGANVLAVMEEIHRVTRDGALVRITVPHFFRPEPPVFVDPENYAGAAAGLDRCGRVPLVEVLPHTPQPDRRITVIKDFQRRGQVEGRLLHIEPPKAAPVGVGVFNNIRKGGCEQVARLGATHGPQKAQNVTIRKVLQGMAAEHQVAARQASSDVSEQKAPPLRFVTLTQVAYHVRYNIDTDVLDAVEVCVEHPVEIAAAGVNQDPDVESTD